MFLKIKRSVWTAIAWTILIFILLVLPNEDLPGDDLFQISDIDKIVHVVLFCIFVWLWSNWYTVRITDHSYHKKGLIAIFIISCVYGIGMEFYQKYFTVRTFDIGDIYADTIGSFLGFVFSYWGKKVSPYRNRGRNQN